MRIHDIMSSPVITVTPETTLERAASLMLENKIGSLVVVRPSNPARPVGIVTETDFDLHGEGLPGVGYSWFKLPVVLGTTVWSEPGFEDVYERARGLPVEQVMNAPCVTTDENEEPMDAARRMVRHGIRHLPVLRDGELVGIVTALDFLVLLAGRPARHGSPV
ncbi:MAG TPA: CBS domain-containing protein [Gaiellaceae bacterium]|nr:CBS domain-containing protein [Gaiellaceae bacterium]